MDTGIATGDAISPDYDSMIAKIIAWGRDRAEAMARLRVALRGTTVVVKGGTTTKSFLLELLDRPEVIDGTADTGWLDRAGLTDDPGSPPTPTPRCCTSASTSTRRRRRWNATRSCGRPGVAGRGPATRSGREVELGYQGQTYSLNVAQISPRRYRVEVAGEGDAASSRSRSSG